MNIPGDIIVSIDGLLNHVQPGEALYVMSPYSHENPAVREERFSNTIGPVLFWSTRGLAPFSPILHSHPQAVLSGDEDVPTDWKTWKSADLPWLKKSDAAVVLMLPGWEESEGVGEEIGYALSLGIRVYYVMPVMGGFSE